MMKLWVPAALGCVVAAACALFYLLSAVGPQDANSLSLVNSVGLAAVVVGIVAAGFVLRRVAPPQ